MAMDFWDKSKSNPGCTKSERSIATAIILGNDKLLGKLPSEFIHDCIPRNQVAVRRRSMELEQGLRRGNSQGQKDFGMVFVHFHPEKTVQLSCDTSPYCIGTILSHIFQHEYVHPIACLLWTLASTDRNYSQLEKEALAPIFTLNKFHS